MVIMVNSVKSLLCLFVLEDKMLKQSVLEHTLHFNQNTWVLFLNFSCNKNVFYVEEKQQIM